MACRGTDNHKSSLSAAAAAVDEPIDNMTGRIADRVRIIIEEVIGGSWYNNADGKQWCRSIGDTVLATLLNMELPYKYIVTCSVMTNAYECGNQEERFSFLDNATDRNINIVWNNESVSCSLAIFALRIM